MEQDRSEPRQTGTAPSAVRPCRRRRRAPFDEAGWLELYRMRARIEREFSRIKRRSKGGRARG